MSLQTKTISQLLEIASNEFSTDGAPLNEKGVCLGKIRGLAGCLEYFLPQRFHVKLRCTLGMKFKLAITVASSNLCQCYPFHESPDLTIKNCPIILEENASGEESEREFVVDQAPQQLIYPT